MLGAIGGDVAPPAVWEIPVDYVMIAQRPDGDKAVKAPYSKDFAACCSAFTASTFKIPHGKLPPVRECFLQCTLMVTSPEDAIRVRAYTWRQKADGTWVADGVWTPETAPKDMNAPRTVYIDLKGIWDARDAETHYVLEMKGSPLVYDAHVRVVYSIER